MVKKKEEGLKNYARSARIWTLCFAIVTVIAGAVFTCFVLNKVSKGTRAEELDVNPKKVEATKSFLGTELQELNEIIARQLGISTTQGALVNSVIDESPADQYDIQRGDVIVRFNRQRVRDVGQLQDLIAETSPGDRAKVVVERDGQTKALYVKLASSPYETGLTEMPSTTAPVALTQGQPSGETPTTPGWGMEVSPLTPEMGQRYGMPGDQKGIVVADITPGGAAGAAGIQVGDIILSANQQPTSDLSEFYASIAGSEGAVLDIFRSGQTLYTMVQADPSKPPMASLGMTTELPIRMGKVAIATVCEDLNAKLSARFGTAQYFLIVKLATNEFIAVINPRGGDTRAYGVRAAQLVIDQGVQAVITPGIGPQAFNVLTQSGIRIYLGTQGETAEQSLEKFKKGQLPEIRTPNILGGTAYIPVGENPNESDDEGYKGMPPIIPPKGEYDPETMGERTTMGPQTTAGTVNRVEVCICPLCGITVSHPAGIPCSQMSCPVCGGRLINASPGIATSYESSRTPSQKQSSPLQEQSSPLQGDPQRPSYAGAAKGQRDLNPVSQSGIQTGGGSEEEEDKGQKPSTIPPMGNPGEALNVVNIWQVSGQPTSESETHQPSAGSQPTEMPPGPIGGQTAGAQTTAGMPSMGRPTGSQTAGAQTTAGAVNRVQACICPVCGTTVGHPAGLPCSELTCPNCGSRLMNASPGMNSSTSQQGGAQQGNMPPSAGQGMAQGGAGSQGMAQGGAGSSGLSSPTSQQSGALQPSTGQGGAQGGAGSSRFGASGSGGPGGDCVCPVCGTIVPHLASVPCYEIKCPKCGTPMVRAIPGVTISDKPETIPPSDKGQGAMTTEGSISKKVAVASQGKDMSSQIAPLFDRAPYFIIVGLAGFEAVRNPNVRDSKDVGIQSAQFVVDRGAGAVIADNISLEAMKELGKLSVKVYSEISGTVSHALEWYVNNRLKETTIGTGGTGKSGSDSHEDEGEGKSKSKKGRDAEKTNVIL